MSGNEKKLIILKKRLHKLRQPLKAKQKREVEKNNSRCNENCLSKANTMVRQEQVPDWLKNPQKQEPAKKVLSE